MSEKTFFLQLDDGNGPKATFPGSSDDVFTTLLYSFGVDFLMGGITRTFEDLIDGGTYALGRKTNQGQEAEEIRKEFDDYKIKQAQEAALLRKIIRDSYALLEGTLFAQIKDVIEAVPVPFVGGFEAICSRMTDEKWRAKPHSAYNTIVDQIQVYAEDHGIHDDGLTIDFQENSEEQLEEKSVHSRSGSELRQLEHVGPGCGNPAVLI